MLNARPAYSAAIFNNKHPQTQCGILAPLPWHVATLICRYTGTIQDDDGTLLLIANNKEEVDRLRRTMATDTFEQARLTSLGNHDNQLTAEEFFATIACEIAANLDLIAEARRRPRLHTLAKDVHDDHEEQCQGRPADQVQFEEEQANGHESDSEEAFFEYEDGQRIEREPVHRLQQTEVLDIALRSSAMQRLDKRSKDKLENCKAFMRNHGEQIQHITAPRSTSGSFYPRARPHPLLARRAENAASAYQAAQRKKRQEEEENSFDNLDGVAAQEEDRNTTSSPVYQTDTISEAVVVKLPTTNNETPAVYARRLAVESGVVNSEDQYAALMLGMLPLHQLWEWASQQGRLDDFACSEGLVRLMRDAPKSFVQRLLLHGPGGSGKTYVTTEVLLRTYKHFCGKACKTFASQNSAARLIGGTTMHYMGALRRLSSLFRKMHLGYDL